MKVRYFDAPVGIVMTSEQFVDLLVRVGPTTQTGGRTFTFLDLLTGHQFDYVADAESTFDDDHAYYPGEGAP